MSQKTSPRVAARAAIVHEGRVLLLRAEEPGRVYFFLPGGHVRHGESLEEAVAREVNEETGLRVKVERALALREYIASRHRRRASHVPPSHHVLAVIFLCRAENPGEGRFASDAGVSGVTGMQWVALDELGPLEIHPPQLKALLMQGLSAEDLQAWLEDA